jgi:hypothetical protein
MYIAMFKVDVPAGHPQRRSLTPAIPTSEDGTLSPTDHCFLP